MWKVFEPWQLSGISRLSKIDQERVETILNTIWNSYPGLFESLAIAAVDKEELTIDAFSKLLSVSHEEVEAKLVEFRTAHGFRQESTSRAVVDVEVNAVAKLDSSAIAVWEVVREFRKLGSLERLCDAFPGIPNFDIASALKYAEQHPTEIEAQIDRYENLLTRRRTDYPFAK